MSQFSTSRHAPDLVADLLDGIVQQNNIPCVVPYMRQAARSFGLQGVTNGIIHIVSKYCKLPMYFYDCHDTDDTVHVYQKEDILYLFIRYCGTMTPEYRLSLIHPIKFYVIKPELSQMILPRTTTVIKIQIPSCLCDKRSILARPLSIEFMVIGTNAQFSIEKFISISKKSKFKSNASVLGVIDELNISKEKGGENIDPEHRPDIMFVECIAKKDNVIFACQKYEPRLQYAFSDTYFTSRKRESPFDLKVELKLFKKTDENNYRAMFGDFDKASLALNEKQKYYLSFCTYVCSCADKAGTLLRIDYKFD